MDGVRTDKPYLVVRDLKEAREKYTLNIPPLIVFPSLIALGYVHFQIPKCLSSLGNFPTVVWIKDQISEWIPLPVQFTICAGITVGTIYLQHNYNTKRKEELQKINDYLDNDDETIVTQDKVDLLARFRINLTNYQPLPTQDEASTF